jgi:hypothetical protein
MIIFIKVPRRRTHQDAWIGLQAVLEIVRGLAISDKLGGENSRGSRGVAQGQVLNAMRPEKCNG